MGHELFRNDLSIVPYSASYEHSRTRAHFERPTTAISASVAMITKGGLTAALLSLASEYAKQHLRFNAVAPGVVDTPMHTNNPKEFLKSLSPMATISSPQDIANAVVYLTEAKNVTGEVLRVDGGSHIGKW